MRIFSSMLRAVRDFITSTIGFIIILSVGVIAAIWIFGPMAEIDDWRPLETELSRLILIGVFILIAVLVLILLLIFRRRREKNLEDEITEQVAEPVDPSVTASEAEIAEVQGRMKQALAILKRAKLGGKSGGSALYQLPWYIIIGPPGAGKTTAIVNSGLKFPLAEKMGKAAVVGVGGTRNCDWWFTNEAVLIDTAGRYTTQESEAEVDAKSWLGFLDMLKKSRARQPINGAIIAVSLADLSLQDVETRRNHALAIRTRLRELRDKLGVRFPVYVWFTKADLIAGFSEYFDRLSTEEREQVWGFTLPLEKGGDAGTLARFDVEFDGLVSRLNDRTVELMQLEVDHRRRSLIYGFPSQVESLRGVAREFLGEVFQESAFEDRQLVRGVYLTSGTQEGTPIDRLMRGMAQTFGIGRQAVGTGQGQGKSYFLSRLLSDVIFGEAGLVSADDAVERRYKWVFRGSIAAGLAVVGLAASLWTVSFLGNRGLVAEAASDVLSYRQAVAGIQITPVQDIDLDAVVPALNILRDMPGNPTVNDPEAPTELTWGLYQGDAIGTEAAQTYRAALNQLLLPRLLLRLEKQLESNINDPDLIYEGLKVYMTLGLQAPSLDTEMVNRWMEIDWALSAYPGPANAALREDLKVHLDALLAQPMAKLQLNGNLVDLVQQRLADRPLAERIYKSIISSKRAKDIPDWRITEAGGPQTTRVLIRPSGEPLSEGIDGIFTFRGFTQVFLFEALEVATRLQSEAWVLGEAGAALTDPDAAERLTRDVLNLYYDDYVNNWDRVLADIDIIPPASLNDAIRITNILSGANSPIKNILESAARETQLTRRPELTDLALPGSAALDQAASVARDNFIAQFDLQTQSVIAALRNSAPPGAAGEAPPPPPPPGQYVEDQFSWLRALTRPQGEGVPSRFDDMLDLVSQVNDELVAAGGPRGPISPGTGEGGAATRLKALAEEPEFDQGPPKRWAIQVVNAAGGLTADTTRDALNKRWQATVAPFCEKAMTNRYPFSRGAAADMTLQDFGRLFGPTGLIDAFFNDHLLDYVDTTAKPWRWKRVGGADLGISANVLAQFQNAADIRDSFFLGAGLPKVTFDLKPFALDSQATSVTLEVHGQELSYAHEVPQVTPMTWPGEAGGRTRIAMTPQLQGAENSLGREGPWAWFRLLDAAQVRRGNAADRSRVVFTLGGRIAVFELRAGSALNPFSLPAMRSFRCVTSL
ncbi:MAG: type VI secretion system membrane subunit TssM [Pikeienuella sp.]